MRVGGSPARYPGSAFGHSRCEVSNLAGPFAGDPIRINHARHQFSDRGVKCRDAALGLLKPKL